MESSSSAEGPGTAPPASASAIAHLYGDQFASPGSAQVHAYASGKFVDLREIATVVMAISLWDLRRRGVIELEWFQQKRLFRTVSGLRVRLVEQLATTGIDAASLNSLISLLSKKKNVEVGAVRVRDVIFGALPNAKNEWWSPIGAVLRQELDEGYLTENPSPSSAADRYLPIVDRVESLAPLAKALCDDWLKFQMNEGVLMAMLKKECQTGIMLSEEVELDDIG